MANSKLKKALALLSGGLDSILAAKIIIEQGVKVEGITFVIGFSSPESAQRAAKLLGIKLHVVDVITEFSRVVGAPRYGYGSHLNPCLDCKIFMVTKATEWLKVHGFDFLISGEVIGQRPKSQRRETLPIVARDSGAEELLLRPLCAKLLPATLPEREGWVERNQLYGISGRSRKEQIELAKSFGIADYPAPAGGCLLTEQHFCDRLRDLWQERGSKQYNVDDIELLKVGRHLRLKAKLKLIIARNQHESEIIEHYRGRFISVEAIDYPGPSAVVDGEFENNDLELIAKIVARFGKGCGAEAVAIKIQYPNNKTQTITVRPLLAHEIKPKWYV